MNAIGKEKLLAIGKKLLVFRLLIAFISIENAFQRLADAQVVLVFLIEENIPATQTCLYK